MDTTAIETTTAHDWRPTHQRPPAYVVEARAMSVQADFDLDQWFEQHPNSGTWSDEDRDEFTRLYEARDAAYKWMVDITATWNNREAHAYYQAWLRESAGL